MMEMVIVARKPISNISSASPASPSRIPDGSFATNVTRERSGLTGLTGPIPVDVRRIDPVPDGPRLTG
jgi:hypothetical protein